jgi:hypothetical protein
LPPIQTRGGEEAEEIEHMFSTPIEAVPFPD